jgi:hypothetical protein
MSNIILDYAVKFSQVDSLPAPSLGFLHAAGFVVPKVGGQTLITLVNAAGTDLTPATILFEGIFAAGSQVTVNYTQDTGGGAASVLPTAVDFTADQMAEAMGEAITGPPQNADATYTVLNGLLSILAIVPATTFNVQSVDDSGVIINPYEVIEVTEKTDLILYTDKWAEIGGLFDGGLNSVYLVMVDTISDLPAAILERESDFYTLLCSTAYTGDDFLTNSIAWGGVRGFSDQDQVFLASEAITKTVCAFLHTGPVNDAYQLAFAFGSFLSTSAWRNQQYIGISQPIGSVTSLGLAESLFNDRISFFMDDDESGTRLAFFVAGGKSITTPYISKEIELLMQFNMTNFITINQPYNVKLERQELEKIGDQMIADYIEQGYLDPDGINDLVVTDGAEVFVVAGSLTTSPSVALWRVFLDAYQTQG